jgi:hypothetical protein
MKKRNEIFHDTFHEISQTFMKLNKFYEQFTEFFFHEKSFMKMS